MSIFSRQRKQPSADYVSPAAADAFMFGQTGSAAFLPAGWRGPKDERDVSLAAADEEYWAAMYPTGQLDRESAEAYMLGVASRTRTASEATEPATDRASTPAPFSAEPPTPVSVNQGNVKAWLLADWFVRDFAPVWLAALGPDDPAVILRGTPELKSPADLPEAQRRIDRVAAMMNGVTETLGGTAAERDLAADITTSCIGGLTDYTNLVTAQGGEALGTIAYQALKLAGIAGTNYLVAGIHSAPPRFRNDAAALQAALRQALQPTVDASNAAIHVLGERLAAVREDDPRPAAPATEVVDRKSPGDGVEPVETAGRTYEEVIAGVQSAFTGEFKHDGALITSVAQSCGDHPQAKEIRRELGRMLAAIAPDDVRAKFDEITESYEGGFEPGLAEARAQMGADNVGAARATLEDLISRYGTGTGLYQDDSVSEYRHFGNDFEASLYVHLYPSEKHLRKLPQDRAALYTDYGAVLLELRDTEGAERALQEALKVNPVSTDAMFELGEVMKLTGRKQEFRELTLRAMAVAYSLATLARAYRNLGYLAVEETDFDIAVACYCMSLSIDRDHAQAAQSELFYIQQVTGRTLELPDRQTVEATLARSGIQVGPSPLVRQLMDTST